MTETSSNNYQEHKRDNVAKETSRFLDNLPKLVTAIIIIAIVVIGWYFFTKAMGNNDDVANAEKRSNSHFGSLTIKFFFFFYVHVFTGPVHSPIPSTRRRIGKDPGRGLRRSLASGMFDDLHWPHLVSAALVSCGGELRAARHRKRCELVDFLLGR